jgi:hypothetical protein
MEAVVLPVDHSEYNFLLVVATNTCANNQQNFLIDGYYVSRNAMDPHRQFWNKQQKELQQALTRPTEHDRAVALFLSQHAMVHAAEVSQSGLWSFEEEVWNDLTDHAARRIPRGCDHSIAWIFWHITRIEDMTMNRLIANTPQLFLQNNWLEKLQVTACDTGNAMDAAAVAQLSVEIDIPSLRAYRTAVGRRTREIIQQVQPGEFKCMVDPAYIQMIQEEGGVVDAASGLLDYWGSKTKGGLLLMPPTRHIFVHLNEALQVKRKT